MMHMHHNVDDVRHAACACTALRKASRAVTRLYEESMAGTGMSIIQFSILRNLARHGALPLMELAELLVMERTTIYRALNPLRRQGWVVLDKGAGRARTATLTRRGRRAMEAATGAWQAAQENLLGRVGLVDWARVESSLARIVDLAVGTGA
jgi:DNA-binding MarR family transcriptional regulator